MEQDRYTPEAKPSLVEIVLEEVNDYRSAVEEIEANQNLSEEQKMFKSSSAAVKHLRVMETLPEGIQLFTMFIHAAEDAYPDNNDEIAA